MTRLVIPDTKFNYESKEFSIKEVKNNIVDIEFKCVDMLGDDFKIMLTYVIPFYREKNLSRLMKTHFETLMRKKAINTDDILITYKEKNKTFFYRTVLLSHSVYDKKGIDK